MPRNDCQGSRDHKKRPEMEITLFSPTKKEMRNKNKTQSTHTNRQETVSWDKEATSDYTNKNK